MFQFCPKCQFLSSCTPITWLLVVSEKKAWIHTLNIQLNYCWRSHRKHEHFLVKVLKLLWPWQMLILPSPNSSSSVWCLKFSSLVIWFSPSLYFLYPSNSYIRPSPLNHLQSSERRRSFLYFLSFPCLHHFFLLFFTAYSTFTFHNKTCLKTSSPHLKISQLLTPPLSILTLTQASLIAIFTVSWTVKTFCLCGVVALQTVRPAGVVQQQIVCLTAHAIRGISLAGCALWGTWLACTTFRKPSRTEAEREKNEASLACCDDACSCVSREMRKQEPLTIHHTHSVVQVKPVSTALARLGIQTHDTSLGTFFTLIGHLVGKGTRWTARHAGLLSSQKTTWWRTEKSMKGWKNEWRTRRLSVVNSLFEFEEVSISSFVSHCLPEEKHLICSKCLPEMQLVQSSFSAPEQVLQDEWHSSQSPWSDGKQRKSMKTRMM